MRASPCEWEKPIWLSQWLFCSLRSPPSILDLKARLTMVTRWRKQAGRRPSRNLRELFLWAQKMQEGASAACCICRRKAGISDLRQRCRGSGGTVLIKVPKTGPWGSSPAHSCRRGLPPSAGAAAASDTGAQKGPVSEATRVMLAIPHSPPRMPFPCPPLPPTCHL